jgi:Domain of unknown function (DUF2431)
METCCDSSSSSSINEHSIISYLILGDGDFSFSYDLARRILLESSSSSPSSPAVVSSPSSFLLTATGIDTLEEVESKYKDSAFLLTKLKGLNLNSSSNNNNNEHHRPRLTVSVQHGVNAIRPALQLDDETESEPSSVNGDDDDHRPQPADIVLFNHPHLGLEDAKLHACFLAHLLDSVDRYWLKKRTSYHHHPTQQSNRSTDHHFSSNDDGGGGGVGIFYMTLALGQWERWKGDEAAARLGWFLVNRLPFQAPLERSATTHTAASAVVDEKPYFQLRRHQTGKSFANRRKANASETFALGRLAEKELSGRLDSSSAAGQLFWYRHSGSTSIHNVNAPYTTTTTTFACPFCDRAFSEQRSVKNHIRCKHANQHEPNGCSVEEQKHKNEHAQPHQQQQEQQQQEWECPYCSNTTNTASTTSSSHVSKRRRRIFENHQALNDHIKAKHQALHSHIPPDHKTAFTAAVAAIATDSGEQQPESAVPTAAIPPAGQCAICLEVFASAHEGRHHMDRFIPPPTTTAMTTAAVSSELDTIVLKQFACSFCDKTFREKRARLRKC